MSLPISSSKSNPCKHHHETNRNPLPPPPLTSHVLVSSATISVSPAHHHPKPSYPMAMGWGQGGGRARIQDAVAVSPKISVIARYTKMEGSGNGSGTRGRRWGGAMGAVPWNGLTRLTGWTTSYALHRTRCTASQEGQKLRPGWSRSVFGMIEAVSVSDGAAQHTTLLS